MNFNTKNSPINWLLIFSLLLLFACSSGEKKLDIQFVALSSVNDIYVPADSLVMPVTYDTLLSLEDLPVYKRKQKFIALILPSILIARFKLKNDLKKVRAICISDTTKIRKRDRKFLDSLKVKYKTNDLEELQKRIMPHPVSLAIAQAAIESAWGTSRFFLEARNAYGIWSFSEDDVRIKASQTRDGTPVFLKKYNSLIESAEDYYLLLSKGPFSDFRNVRASTNDVFELLPTLTKYSEQENIYIQKLSKIINKNKLTKFDSYQIDPDYIFDD